MHFQRRKFNSLSQLYNTFTREIPNTENNFYPISLSNYLNPSPTIYLFPVISLNPEIGIRFLSPYFFLARREGGRKSSDKKQEFLASRKLPKHRNQPPSWLGRGNGLKLLSGLSKAAGPRDQRVPRGSVEKRIRGTIER